MPRSSRIKLSLAGTAAVALASLPLGITPASAAKVTEGTTSRIGIMEASPNSQQFNLGSLGAQSVAIYDGRVGTAGGGRKFVVPAFLLFLAEFLGFQTTQDNDSIDNVKRK